MPNQFHTSDHHFGHANILTFKHKDGVTPVRDFSCLEEMHEHMIERHNSVVRPNDTVYFHGDFSWNTDPNNILFAKRLNGKKFLIPGNHDHEKMSEYEKYFEISYTGKKIKVKDRRIVLSHYPIHESAFFGELLNVHGHTHQTSIQNIRYFNVSVEAIDYVPVHYDQLVNYINLYL